MLKTLTVIAAASIIVCMLGVVGATSHETVSTGDQSVSSKGVSAQNAPAAKKARETDDATTWIMLGAAVAAIP